MDHHAKRSNVWNRVYVTPPPTMLKPSRIATSGSPDSSKRQQFRLERAFPYPRRAPSPADAGGRGLLRTEENRTGTSGRLRH
jgi:hypothetical protein